MRFPLAIPSAGRVAGALLLAATALGASTWALSIPDGSCAAVTKQRPSLPHEAGAPSPSRWLDRTPFAAEDDTGADDEFGAFDDELGPATGGGSQASVRICNSGGDLFGPMGGDQNGPGEGDCIEVKICWWYWGCKLVTVPVLSFDPPGIVWVQVWDCGPRTVCSSPCEVCPG